MCILIVYIIYTFKSIPLTKAYICDIIFYRNDEMRYLESCRVSRKARVIAALSNFGRELFFFTSNKEREMEKFNVHWAQRAKALIADRVGLDAFELLWADSRETLKMLGGEDIRKKILGGKDLLSIKPQDDLFEKALITLHDALLEYLEKNE